MSNPISTIVKTAVIGGIAYGSFKLGEKSASIKRASSLKDDAANYIGSLIQKCSCLASDAISNVSEAVIETCTRGEGDDSFAAFNETPEQHGTPEPGFDLDGKKAVGIVVDTPVVDVSDVSRIVAEWQERHQGESKTNDAPSQGSDDQKANSLTDNNDTVARSGESMASQVAAVGNTVLHYFEKAAEKGISSVTGSPELDKVRGTVLKKMTEISQTLKDKANLQ